MTDEEGERYPHYVVVRGQDQKEYLLINDPCHGEPSCIPKDIFMKKGQELNWGNKQWGIEVFKNS